MGCKFDLIYTSPDENFVLPQVKADYSENLLKQK